MRLKSTMLLLRVFAVAALAFSTAAVAQSTAPITPDEADADHAYTTHDWANAEQLYTTLTQRRPDYARYWYRLGVSARGNGHLDSALEDFKKAKELGAGKGLPAPQADYELASTNAAAGNRSAAIALLKASADGGFSQTARLDEDAGWTAFRDDPQFQALVKQIHHNAAPCEDPEFRQFDFWIGDWDVASTGDEIARGTSHISKEIGDCVIWENWASAGSGYFGKSYNTYNVNLRRWEQYWVDNGAGVMFFHGNLKDGNMDYWTDDIPQPDGTKLRRHLQFFNLSPDKVRQFSQGSKDGGKTWYVEYDLTYRRRGSNQAKSR
jgi:tetratricopeptide (TPR) repeat protein